MLQQLRKAILPARVIAKVVAVNADGTVTAVTDSGKQYRAVGTDAVDSMVYIQDGRVLGQAPALTHYEIGV
ncbi:hypothetical protein L9G74_19135 [Shewanella sp. C32]|uniref:Uncharacterized protein n=1 Tax=Shewanella electrica TaxID=515560 RepID=A0ABT2FSC2_9GAMM|nr:hypothetical protein [Shewanella electrica]MCH1926856.1 hypothetical protein [Shewanella electrica]MCS4558555.1 hypothetical protein [Shewanella electrica]